jgi:hypothetical protein
MILAEVTNYPPLTLPDPHSPAAIGWLLIGVASLFVILNAAIDFWRKITKGPGAERRDVMITSNAATLADLKEHIVWDGKEHEKLWAKVGGVERGAAEKLAAELKALRDERHNDAQELQRKLDMFQKSIGGLETATQIQNQQLAQIQMNTARAGI